MTREAGKMRREREKKEKSTRKLMGETKKKKRSKTDLGTVRRERRSKISSVLIDPE